MMKKVISTKNVYTGRERDLCRRHYKAQANGDIQVQHGLHASPGGCDACREELEADPSPTN
jgi:hypothetical protein